MAQRKRLSVNTLEFDAIKNNIKEFLRGQETFRDYDFDGSGLSVLLDILAYNTYYQAFYNNVVANEMFLDSAVKRSSVISHAKNLGYTPSSRTAPTAYVDVTFGSVPAETVILPGEQFVTNINGSNYTFVNVDSAQIDTSSEPHITNLAIKQGSLKSISYLVPDQQANRKYAIPEENVDISTIRVRVQASQTDSTGASDIWTRATDLTTIDSTSKAYFVEENTEGLFQIFFGDDVLGQKIDNGNLITITYLITDGPSANGVGSNDSESDRTFIYGSSANVVEVKSPASGGSNKESIESIRFKAPRAYATQNRAVTKEDYSSLIDTNFTGFESVFVFGGEEADPPEFGSVFVAIKPNIGTNVSEEIKNEVQNFLSQKAVLSITPKVVDPDYTYLRFDVNFYYDENATTLSTSGIISAVRNSMILNINNNVGKFNRTFSLSKLLSDIDNTSDSIESSKVNVTMEKRLLPVSDLPVSYVIKYGNSIYHPHDGHMSVISSNEFVYLDPDTNLSYNVKMKDDGFGNINLVQTQNSIETTIKQNVGTVDYSNGVIFLNLVQVQSPEDTPYIRVYATANNQRYVSIRDLILFNDYATDPSAIKITAVSTNPIKSTSL